VLPEQVTPQALALQIAAPVPEAGLAHTPQAPPGAPFPQEDVVCAAVTHPPLLQQPFVHEVALQATQAPWWQIAPVPQLCPSRTLVRLEQAGPAAQVCVPVWQTLPLGLHCAPVEHATQAPLLLQTPVVAPDEQGLPGATAVP
jgi:hypothetical protein